MTLASSVFSGVVCTSGGKYQMNRPFCPPCRHLPHDWLSTNTLPAGVNSTISHSQKSRILSASSCRVSAVSLICSRAARPRQRPWVRQCRGRWGLNVLIFAWHKIFFKSVWKNNNLSYHILKIFLFVFFRKKLNLFLIHIVYKYSGFNWLLTVYKIKKIQNITEFWPYFTIC